MLELLVASLCFGAVAPLTPLPAFVPLPEGYALVPDGRQYSVAYGHESFHWAVPPARPGERETREMAELDGAVWVFSARLEKPVKPPLNEEQVFKVFLPVLEAKGWKFLSRPPMYIFHRAEAESEGYLQLEGDSTYVRVRLILKASRTRMIEQSAPGKSPEPWKEGVSVPYLAPFPGGALKSATVKPDYGFEWVPDANGERQWVGHPALALEWVTPDDVSPYELSSALKDAMTAGGWSVWVLGAPGSAGDATMRASYSRDGRDLYASFHLLRGSYTAVLADMGLAAEAKKLKEALTHGCVSIYGVYFDFDKATLKPASEATLGQVLTLLKDDAALKLAINGHTDNVGTREHNQPLSENRAKGVREWLVAHGVAGARLSSAGFADTKPIADNATSDGRAKNRRVELCKP